MIKNTAERSTQLLREHRTQVALGCLVVFVALLVLFKKPVEQIPDFGDLPDFATIRDARERKAAFFDYLTPIVHYHNGRIRAERAMLKERLGKVENGESLDSNDEAVIERLAVHYEQDWNPNKPAHSLRQLLLRVDILPLELVLVQAAKESGWGRSRLAVTANNLFGQWCYSPGCGIVPRNRAVGKTHEVQRFATVSEAIRAYMDNLNTHTPYKTLRLIRAGLRVGGEAIDGVLLADGLLHYSQRRGEYVAEVKSMIRQYRRFEESREEEQADA